MSCHVEIITDDDNSYRVLRCIRPMNPFTTAADVADDYINTDTDSFKPKPDIVIMRESDIILEFIQTELQRFNKEKCHTDTSDHPFIMHSVTHPNRHDIYTRDGEQRVRLMVALVHWADTPCEERNVGDTWAVNREEGNEGNGNHTLDADEPDFDAVDGPISIDFAQDLMFLKGNFQELNTPWQPAMVMTFSNDTMDLLDEIVKSGDDNAVTELYERWVAKYEVYVGLEY